MDDQRFIYCPLCATPLIEKEVFYVQRQACPACHYISFLDPKVVTVVVVCHEDKVLLGRRNMNPGKGQWSFLGGYVERGEKLEAAALREVKEEANIDVQLERLVGIYSQKNNPHILIVYQASVIDGAAGSLLAQDEEISELAFFSWHDLPPLAFPDDYLILRDLNQGVS